MVRGARNPFPVDFFFGAHQRERHPGVCSRDELSEEFEVDAHGITLRHVASVIDEAEVIDGVGDEVRERLVVCFRGELEWSSCHSEGIVCSEDEVDGALRFDVFVQHDVGDARCVECGVFQFFVEGCLVVDAGGEAESPVVCEGGHESDGDSG